MSVFQTRADRRAPNPSAEPLAPRPPGQSDPIVLSCRTLRVWYASSLALKDITIDIPRNKITALIGPSGCGKSTLLRCFNRMNDLINGARMEGEVRFDDKVISGADIDTVALRRAALWDEVKTKLNRSGLELSGGQQQRLCIARTLAVEPEVILMDEPCSALDPISTARVEDLMDDLKNDYTIVIVTHNMQQARRVSDLTACLMLDEASDDGHRTGILAEFSPTDVLFTNPKDKRTEAYITGRIG